MTFSPASQTLTALNIPHREFIHPGPVDSLEQAAAERGQTPEQVIRSILFRLGESEFALVLAAGQRQISWKALRSFFGQSRLTMATPEEVLQVTGYAIGAVSPFSLTKSLRILVDVSVLNQGEVSIGSGVRGTSIFIQTADLKRALGEVETGKFLVS